MELSSKSKIISPLLRSWRRLKYHLDLLLWIQIIMNLIFYHKGQTIFNLVNSLIFVQNSVNSRRRLELEGPLILWK